MLTIEKSAGFGSSPTVAATSNLMNGTWHSDDDDDESQEYLTVDLGDLNNWGKISMQWVDKDDGRVDETITNMTWVGAAVGEGTLRFSSNMGAGTTYHYTLQHDAAADKLVGTYFTTGDGGDPQRVASAWSRVKKTTANSRPAFSGSGALIAAGVGVVVLGGVVFAATRKKGRR